MKKTSDVVQYSVNGAKEMGRQATNSAISTIQDSVQSGVSKVQDALLVGLGVTQELLQGQQKRSAKNLRKANKKAQKNLKKMQGTLQSQLERRARRRKRAKTMFRLGLLSGFIVMVLYTPWPGSETRRQLVEFWQGLFPPQEL